MKNFKYFVSIAGASLCGSSIFFAIFNLIQDINMPAAEFFFAGIACLTLVNSLDLAHINLYREVDELFQKETNRRLKELSEQVLHQQGETMQEWNELIKTVKHAWQYGIHCNDMTLGEIEEDISSALDRFAKANGLPEVNWEEEE